jgi:pyrroline-5-carboxylate reductase
MSNIANTKIAFIGAGNMASAIIGGLIAKGFNAANIWASDPYQESLDKLQAMAPVNTSQDNNAIIAHADVVVLAVKPQQMKAVCADIKDSLNNKKPLVISIAAGITCVMLEQWLSPATAIVRCMPNTPALVQTSASGLCANTNVSAHQRETAHQLLESIGIVSWVEQESLLDAVTALSGSGPAYFFMVMELMVEAGKQLGLDAATAEQLTLQTALGAARMAISSDVDVKELRRRVTSPKGTTEAAIKSFEADHLQAIFLKALSAADARSKSLAEEMLKQ